MSRLLALWPDEAADAGEADGLPDFVNAVQGLGPGLPIELLVIGARRGRPWSLPEGCTLEVRHVVHEALMRPLQPVQLLALLAPLLRGRLKQDDAVLLPASALGRELCARLAARLEGRAVGLCAGLGREGDAWRADKALWAGRVQLALQVPGRLFAVVQPAPVEGGLPSERPAPPPDEWHGDALPEVTQVRHERPAARRRPVEQAGIVVSGGRGMGGPEGFVQLEAIAALLPDAAVGGSLPAVDAGWVPVSHQVGQSGKYVGPRLYVAVALSGTPQHLAGVAPHTQIVAINKDPAADIFRRARVGVVAEWQAFLPLLAARLADPEGR